MEISYGVWGTRFSSPKASIVESLALKVCLGFRGQDQKQ